MSFIKGSIIHGKINGPSCINYLFFFFKQKTAYEIMPSLVGSEMCIRDSPITVQVTMRSATSEYTRVSHSLPMAGTGVSPFLPAVSDVRSKSKRSAVHR